MCSAVLHEVATVCNNYPKHTDSNIAERAQAVLRRALHVQPPCTIKYMEGAYQPGAFSIMLYFYTVDFSCWTRGTS